MSPSPKVELVQGTLDLIILRLLRAGPANGWDLTNAIQATTRGVLDVNYGSVYPTLRRLEAKGYVAGKWGTSENNRRARYYDLTPSGQRQLEVEKSEWVRFTRALDLILHSR